MEQRLVTVSRFLSPLEADLALSRLQAEGVPSFLQDANTVSINWLYAPALGGIRLQVPCEWEAKAREILEGEPSEILDGDFNGGPGQDRG